MTTELRAWTNGDLDKIVTKTDGYWVEYSDGTRLLDVQSGNSAYILGYGNQEVLNSLNSDVNFVRGNRGETCELAQEMVKHVCETGNWDVLSWAISGSSAVESAIKMNDQYWGNPENYIVTFTPSFHGTTFLCRAMGDDDNYVKRIKKVPTPLWKKKEDQISAERKSFKYLQLLLKTYRGKVGCVVMETLPWLKGGIPWSPSWWKMVRHLCDEENVLLIVDDVACCWGKSGHWHGWQKYDVQPDISALGKSLTAGYTPLGCSVANKKVGDVIKNKDWEFGHTWQPTMTGIKAMSKVVEIIEREDLFSLASPIEFCLKMIAENLLDRGYITSYRCNDLFLSLDPQEKYMDANGDLSMEAFMKSGLSLTKTRNGSIRLIANFRSDAIFFEQMEKRLIEFFQRQ